jgi:spermidine synthase
MPIDLDALQERLRSPAYARASNSLEDVGFKSGLGLLATYAGQARDLGPWLKGAEINHDRDLRLQYLAGLAPNRYEEALIYDDLLVYRRFPTNLFIGSAGRRLGMRLVIEKLNSAK